MPKRSSLPPSTATSASTAPVLPSRRKARTAYLLAQAHFAMRIRIDDALRNLEVTGLQYTVLSLVNQHPALSSAELSRRFFRTQQAMGQLLSGLEERGWLVREEDPANRRILRVTLTNPGRALVASGGEAIDAVEDHAFSAFTAAEIKVFRTVLESFDTHAPMPRAARAAARKAVGKSVGKAVALG